MALDVYKDWLGIPEDQRPPNQYQLLRLVEFEDDLDKVNKNYKKLNAHVRKYATGQYSVQSQELMNELAKAMLCLKDPERKREYDESIGREFEEAKSITGHRLMQNVLQEKCTLTKDQVKEAQSFADSHGLSIRDAMVQLNLADEDSAAEALAAELGLSYIDLADVIPDDSVLDLCPRNVVKRNSILPLFVDGEFLLVACTDQPTHELEDEMRLRYEVPMRAVIATPLAINQAIAKYYAAGMRDEAVAKETSGTRKTASTKRTTPVVQRRRLSQLSEGEQKQRKSMGYIFMMWGFIGSVLFDEFILKPYVLPQALQIPFVPSFTTLIVTPIVVWYVLKVYLK